MFLERKLIPLSDGSILDHELLKGHITYGAYRWGWGKGSRVKEESEGDGWHRCVVGIGEGWEI